MGPVVLKDCPGWTEDKQQKTHNGNKLPPMVKQIGKYLTLHSYKNPEKKDLKTNSIAALTVLWSSVKENYIYTPSLKVTQFFSVTDYRKRAKWSLIAWRYTGFI